MSHLVGRGGRPRFAPGLVALVALVGPFGASAARAVDRGVPATLAETGLYSDFARKLVAPGVRPFSPQYPLWSDGATKRRWIRLPDGASIDGSDPDAWVFPIGTRVWKEFSFGRRIETRFMERASSGGWLYATYRWNEAESEALLVSERGVKRACESRPGVAYSLPSVVDCRACHESAASQVIGFSALQLSPDRDPAALHEAPLESGALDLLELVREQRVVGLPGALLASPPRVRARSATERAALGYLHGNCGHCHHRESPIANLGLFLDVRADGTPEALASAVDRPSYYRPAGTAIEVRVAAGRPGESLLIARVASRDPARQMPPSGTHVVDDEALALLTRWIAEDLAPPAPEAAGHPVSSLAPTGEIPEEDVR